MKKINAILLFGLLLIAIAGCAQQSAQDFDGGKSPPAQATTGRVVFTITDAAAEMGSVSSIKVTVDSIKVQSASKGWIDVSSPQKTYDLLQLKASDENALLADIELEEGKYGQIRLDISNVVVTDAEGEHDAKLPSGELKIIADLAVESNSTSTVNFDFIADESLHRTGNRMYIMAPVIKIEIKENADVEIENGNSVSVKGGIVKTNVEVGMDIDGNVGAGLKIPADVDLSIDAKGLINLGKGQQVIADGKGRAVFLITDAAANMESVSKVEVTVDSLEVHSVSEGWVTVLMTPKTYDLLKLSAEGKQELLADIQLDEGVYTQIRLNVSNVIITDAQGEHDAKLPSNELKIVGNVVINENSTSAVIFDFLANESLHITGNNEYIMAPVIKLETREDADVQLRSDNSAEVSGGRKTEIKMGMDIYGNMGIGIKIAKNTKISINAKDGLVIG